MSSATVKVAVVGAGRQGQVHLSAFSAAEGTDPVAIVDPDPTLREAAERRGLAVYRDVEDLLDVGGFDAVVISAPTRFHLELVQVFSSAQVPMLCEKPCGLSSAETTAAATAAAAAEVPLQIGFWMRFVPELAELRRRIQSGGLGDVLSVACWMWDAEPPSREYLRTSGGMALDMGVHEIDRTRWLVGQDFEYIAAVAAQPTGAAEFVDEPAAAQVIGSLSGGATASISLGRRFERGDCAWSEVMGTNGYARSTFLWGEEGQHVLAEAVHAQAEVFAQSVRTGAVLDGAASAENAINTVTTAERVREALRRTSGGHL